MTKADLHVHTKVPGSDGQDPPLETVKKYAEKGYSHIAITDHNTFGGVRQIYNKVKAVGTLIEELYSINSEFTLKRFDSIIAIHFTKGMGLENVIESYSFQISKGISNSVKYVCTRLKDLFENGIDLTLFKNICRRLTIFPGVELDAQYEGERVHVLGIFNPGYTKTILDIEKDRLLPYKEKRAERIEKIVDNLIEKYKLSVRPKEIHRKLNYVSATIAELADVLLPYFEDKPISRIKDGDRVLNEGWQSYVKKKKLIIKIQKEIDTVGYKNAVDVFETIDFINRWGGIAVIAHPKSFFVENPGLLRELKVNGLRGIEVYTTKHNEKEMGINEKAAEKEGVFKSFGSDGDEESYSNILQKYGNKFSIPFLDNPDSKNRYYLK